MAVSENPFALVRIRIFTFARLWLFILGLILAAMIASATSGFVLGISQKDFFLEDRPDILIVGDPTSTTPITGRVPIQTVSDIAQLKGVETVSPEVLGYCIVDNLDQQPIAFRGVGSPFFDIENVILEQGKIPQEILEGGNETLLRSVLLGFRIAEQLDVRLGNWLVISSSLTDIRTAVMVSGIVRTGTPSDDELLIPFNLGQALADLDPTLATLIRVKISLEETSKQIIHTNLNSVYNVRVNAKATGVEENRSLEGARIDVTTTLGQRIETDFLDKNNSVSFELSFGTYDFCVIQEGVDAVTIRYLILNDTTLNIDVSPPPTYNLQVTVLKGEENASNADVGVTRIASGVPLDWTRRSLIVPTNGTVLFRDLSEGHYEVNATLEDWERVENIHLLASEEIALNLHDRVVVKVHNATEESLPIFSAEVCLTKTLNGENWTRTTNQTGIAQFYVPSDHYELSATFGSFETAFNITTAADIHFQVYLGNGTLIVNVLDNYGMPYDNATVSVTTSEEEQFENVTDENGQSTFTLAVGSSLTISAQSPDGENNNSRMLFWEKSSTENLTLYKFQNYTLPVRVIDRLTQDPVVNASVEILDRLAEVIAVDKTNSSGHATFQLPGPKEYQINVTLSNYSETLWITLYNDTLIEIQIGAYHVQITSLTSDSFMPLSEATVMVYESETLIENVTTDLTGVVSVYLTTGNYTVGLTHPFWDGNPVFEELEVNTTSSKQINRYLFITANLSLRIKDESGASLEGVRTALVPQFLLQDPDLIPQRPTDNDGKVAWANIPWGSYRIELYYLGYFHTIMISLQNESRLELELEMPLKEQSVIEYHPERWIYGVKYSVASSKEHVSGFFRTTLASTTLTLTGITMTVTLVVVASVFSLVEYPVTRTKEEIEILAQVGANRTQIVLGLALQLLTVAIVSLLVGSILGMLALQHFTPLQNAFIGAIIVTPEFSWQGVLFVTIIAELVVAVAAMKVLVAATDIQGPHVS